VLESIDVDEQTNQFKLMGVIIDYSTIHSIVLALVSLLLAYLYQTMKNAEKIP